MTEPLIDAALHPSHAVMRRLRSLLREAMRLGPPAPVVAVLVLALRVINDYLGD